MNSIGSRRAIGALLIAVSAATSASAYAEALANHQFSSIRNEDVQWQTFPAFPEGAKLAVIVGNPSQPGPYVVRVKVPDGLKLMPHTHPEDRIYTVISGVFYIGQGTTFDADKLVAYGPGSVVVLPANTPHFHWAKSGEYVSQVYGIGPLGLKYINATDDPRRAR